jgi:GNAT superfamily N-acetyltransferase
MTPRPAETRDAQDLMGLLSLCYAEYPGCFLDPHGDVPDLLDPARSYAGTGGRFLVVEDTSGRVAACIAVDFPQAGEAELHRLYVRPDFRRNGVASRLVGEVERIAGQSGAAKLVLWTDTRFTNAHRLYARLGFRKGETTRSLGDISHSREFFFAKAL